jgi:hypothetical protein
MRNCQFLDEEKQNSCEIKFLLTSGRKTEYKEFGIKKLQFSRIQSWGFLVQ